MRLWHIHRMLMSAAICLGLAAAAGATETAVVTRAEGYLHKSVVWFSSPVPSCYVLWQHAADEGTSFHVVPEDCFATNPQCAGELTAHCGGDTLAFTGWWPRQEIAYHGNFHLTILEAILHVDLLVTAPTTVTASRQWTGDLARADHKVVLTTAAGEPVLLLSTDDDVDEARMVLAPGAYGVDINVQVRTRRHEFPAYEGAVTVAWDDASTPVETTTWGGLKALYR